MADHIPITGGCQCGAIRYRIEAPLGPAGLCYCRMCQKAFGSIGAPLVSVPHAQFRWTRGTPATWRSSPIVERGFCRDCGTPLFMLEEDHPAGLGHAVDLVHRNAEDAEELQYLG